MALSIPKADRLIVALLMLAAQATCGPVPPAAAPQQPGDSSANGGGRPTAGRSLALAGGPCLLPSQALAAQPPVPPDATTSNRQLRQAEEAVDRCGGGPEPEEERECCVACGALQRSKTAACRVWIDRVALHFPRGSTQPPSPHQLGASLAALRGSCSPSTGCCKTMVAALQGRCGCNPLFQHVRNETAIDEPMLSVEYLKGSNSILARACGLTDASQLACA